MRALLLFFCTALLFAAPGTSYAQAGDSLCIVTESELSEAKAATPDPGTTALEGRLGGSQHSFTQQYGEAGAFAQDGCSTFSSISSQPGTNSTTSVVTIIGLWVARDSDIEAGTLDDPNDANWSLEEAEVIAGQLLPADTVLDEPEETDAENALATGHSESLAEVLSVENYAWLGSDGTPGDVEVLYGLSRDGTVWSITVQLGGIN